MYHNIVDNNSTKEEKVMKRSVRGKRKVNLKNCYILFVSLVAFLSLMGNVFQNIYYNKAITIQQETIDTFVAEYSGATDTTQTASLNFD